MHNVTNHTRAPRDGRVIVCPNCATHRTIYRFNWSALLCKYCKNDVPKKQWLTY
jgi:hypothetical protein